MILYRNIIAGFTSLIILFSFCNYDANALRSEGTPILKYGSSTKQLVCGDLLCSDDDNRSKIYFKILQEKAKIMLSMQKEGFDPIKASAAKMIGDIDTSITINSMMVSGRSTAQQQSAPCDPSINDRSNFGNKITDMSQTNPNNKQHMKGASLSGMIGEDDSPGKGLKPGDPRKTLGDVKSDIVKQRSGGLSQQNAMTMERIDDQPNVEMNTKLSLKSQTAKNLSDVIGEKMQAPEFSGKISLPCGKGDSETTSGGWYQDDDGTVYEEGENGGYTAVPVVAEPGTYPPLP